MHGPACALLPAQKRTRWGHTILKTDLPCAAPKHPPLFTSIALVGRQYGSEYVAAEEGAHAAGRGIWVGEFELPAQWRRERKIDRLLAAPPLTVPAFGAFCSPTSAAQQCSKQQVGDCAGLLAAPSLAEPARAAL